MGNDLGANLAGPKEQICQRVADFVFRKLSNLADLGLSLSAVTNRFAHAIRRRKFPEHSRDASGREAGRGIDRQPVSITCSLAAMLYAGVLIFAQCCPT